MSFFAFIILQIWMTSILYLFGASLKAENILRATRQNEPFRCHSRPPD